MNKFRHAGPDLQMSVTLAEFRRKKKKKENLIIFVGLKYMFFIGKLRDVQLGAGFGPSLLLTRTEEVYIPDCFCPTR